MSETILLIKTFLRNSLASSRGKKQFAKILITILPFALMIYLSLLYSFTLYQTLPKDYYHYGLYAMMGGCFMVILFMGITYSQGMLFGFKDYDLLMSFPIKKDSIVISKFASFFLMMFTYAFLFGVPSLIVYGYYAEESLIYYVISIFGFLFYPLVPMVLSSLIGYFIKRVSAGKKHSNLINNIFSAIVVIAILSMNLFRGSSEVSELSPTLDKYINFIPTLRLYVEGIIHRNYLYYFLFIGVSLLVFFGFIRIFSDKIMKVSALGNQGYHEENFELKETKSQSQITALIKREAKRYFMNFNYVMNTAIGLVFVWIFVIYTLFNPSILQSFPIQQYEADFLPPMFIGIGIFLFLSSMTACSISLEGKTLWILKSLPIKVEDIFKSKALFNILLLLIALVPAFLILAYQVKASMYGTLLSILYLVSASIFVSLYGLVLNLKFPKLEFDREIVVIKQSLSVFLNILSAFIVTAIMFGVYFLGMIYFKWDGYTTLLIICMIYVVLDVILFVLLKNWGVKRFRNL